MSATDGSYIWKKRGKKAGEGRANGSQGCLSWLAA
jgi:hypothetical protein